MFLANEQRTMGKPREGVNEVGGKSLPRSVGCAEPLSLERVFIEVQVLLKMRVARLIQTAFLMLLGCWGLPATGQVAGEAPAGIEFETPAMPSPRPADWPTYHLVHPGKGTAIPGDPNCLFFWKGRYHLHYIYENKGMSFGHVSSTDMVHWEWHPTTLVPKVMGHGMFSGTGFYTKEGKPAIIYHGQGSGKNWIAYSEDDRLERWSKPEALVVLAEDGFPVKMKFWDPDCWRMGDTDYALSGGKNPRLMKSDDLKTWKALGALFHDDFPANLGVPVGEDISCANFFKIGNQWMLLCISHRLGCRYYLGDFKDEKYLPKFHGLMSWNGRNFFAPESMLTPDGRRVMWAWLFELPLAPTGVQALPRELELPADGVLRIRPLRELEALRFDGKKEVGIVVKAGEIYPLKGVEGSALEIEVTAKVSQGAEFGIEVLGDQDGRNGVRIAVNADGQGKSVEVGKVVAPFALEEGEDLSLRVFVDKNLVEVFVNGRQAVVTAIPFVAKNTAVHLFSNRGGVEVKAVQFWKMQTMDVRK